MLIPPMSRRRITTEWLRYQRTPSFARRRRWGSWGLMCAAILAVIFVGKGCMSDSSSSQIERTGTEDTGGGAAADPVSEVLSGKVLTVPLETPVVLEEGGEAKPEASLAQNTKEVIVEARDLETALASVGDPGLGSGTASSQFKDGTFQFVAVASMPSPPQGYFYEAWLIRSKPFDFFSAGKLIQHADDLKWYGLYTSAEDKTSYRRTVITLEADDKDPAPGEHILEGMLKP